MYNDTTFPTVSERLAPAWSCVRVRVGRGRLYITMRPLYRLTTEFERKWPIEVAYGDLPTLLSPPMYNAATLLSTLGFSAVSLTTGLVGRTFISLCYIPSHSMYPSIEVRWAGLGAAAVDLYP